MSQITAQQVKALREQTGAGMMDAKKALVEAAGNIDSAIDLLRKSGAAKASKKTDRDTSEGLVDSYLHAGGKIGVMVEVNCESDFVARTADFKTFVHDLAMHIAASSPSYVTREEVPADVLQKEKEIFVEIAKGQDKPEGIALKIAEGKLEGFYAGVVLLDQPFVKDSSQTISELLTAIIARLGENIRINRFARFEIGG